METGIKEKLLQVMKTINGLDDFILDDSKGVRISYESFWEQCLCIAAYLDKYPQYGTIIAILENSSELLELYFAVMLTDKKIMVIDPLKGTAEIEEILNEVQDGILITEENVNIPVAKERFFNVCFNELQSGQSDYKGENSFEKVRRLMEKRDFCAEYLVTYTSGTSGKPKGVVHSLDNLFGAAFAIQKKVNASEGIFMHVMPMTYMAGILNSIFFPFITRNKIVVMRRFSVKTAMSFWKKVSEYKINLFWLSPAMLMMIQKMDRSNLGEGYCRKQKVQFLIGTSHLAERTREQFEMKYGVKLQASYGLSETLFISVETANSIKKGEKNSVGELLDGVDYQVLSDGELLLSVPWMYLGYTNEDDASYFSGTYYKTGDLAECRDGNLFITGRKKDLIIKGGMNISPIQIENCVNRCKFVTACAVFGMENGSEEEMVCCAYEAQIDNASEKQQIEEKLNQKVMDALGKNYRVDSFILIDRLPRNVNGKIDKEMLRSRCKEMLVCQEEK